MLFIFALSVGAQAGDDPRLHLTPLKPKASAPVRRKPVTVVSGYLMNSASENVLDQIRMRIGDCEGCARGIAVAGVLGIRLEGDSVDALSIVKTGSRHVRYRDCKQAGLSRAEVYECTFSFGASTYTVKLVAGQKLKP